MNHIEARALKWIAKTTGYPEDQISFTNNSSPDFTTPNGQGFEVKHLPVIMWPRQWAQLEKRPGCSILIFGEDNQPEAIIPITELQYGTKRGGNIPICYLARCPGSTKRTMLREDYIRKVKENKQAAEETTPAA